jgi:two-component system, OmpR family, response regulator CpxR
MRTVLLVEDDPTLAYFTARNLSQGLGAEVDVASVATCAEAEVFVERTRPCVVVVDLCLTDGNGLDLIRAMRTRFPRLPAIVTSGMLPADLAPESLLALLAKPYEMHDLLALVQDALAGTSGPVAAPRLTEVDGKRTNPESDRHLIQNRLASVLTGLRSLEADLRLHGSHSPKIVELLNDRVDALCDAVKEVSRLVAGKK